MGELCVLALRMKTLLSVLHLALSPSCLAASPNEAKTSVAGISTTSRLSAAKDQSIPLRELLTPPTSPSMPHAHSIPGVAFQDNGDLTITAACWKNYVLLRRSEYRRLKRQDDKAEADVGDHEVSFLERAGDRLIIFPRI